MVLTECLTCFARKTLVVQKMCFYAQHREGFYCVIEHWLQFIQCVVERFDVCISNTYVIGCYSF